MDMLLTFDGKKFDLGIFKNDFKTDDGLETAVIISLFTDARCSLEELPAEEKSKRGWWGDAIPEVDGEITGSKLWLLRREKQTDETRKRAKDTCEEALAWMIEDKLAEQIIVETEWVEAGFLGIKITIQRPKGQLVFKYKINWNAQAERDQ